jgi:hypothetical protein
MTHKGVGFTRVFFSAGLMEIALGVAFLAAPVQHLENPDSNAEHATIGMQTARGEQVSPVISFILIASGIVLTVANARPGRRKPKRSQTSGDPNGSRGEASGNLRPRNALDCAISGGRSQSEEIAEHS